VFFQCVVNYIYAFVMSFVEKLNDTTRSSYYDICSFTYLLAMVTSNKTQSWVNYPIQVVGKSYRPAYPCHDCGGAVGKKMYLLVKNLFTMMIVVAPLHVQG
jgi:UDP-galactose transporter B1